MKCLLVLQKWQDQVALSLDSGRPYLDLLLEMLGFSRIDVLELDPDSSFDPVEEARRYKLILVHGKSGSRLRRSILSNLGLSLGLAGEHSDQLRVVGAHQITRKNGVIDGFTIQRRGCNLLYLEQGFWPLHEKFIASLQSVLKKNGVRQELQSSCWLVEGALSLEEIRHDSVSPVSPVSPDSSDNPLSVRALPNGDSALMIPKTLGSDGEKHLQELLKGRLYVTDPQPLELFLSVRLRQKGLRVSVAESCTAGLVSARLTSVPGSSACFLNGFITYSNLSKRRCLEVPEVLFQRCGAVSPEVAIAMSRGALRAAESDLAVAVTGIAGPDGGSEGKPVGTVFLAAVDREGNHLEHRGFYHGSRDRIRLQASQTALHLLRRML